MPSLSDRLVDTNTVTMTTPTMSAEKPAYTGMTQPLVYNSFQRCPLPAIWDSNPDSVRQFYLGNKVPQNRIYS